eukprot:791973-Ditylum_brightwellii.AAC.1
MYLALAVEVLLLMRSLAIDVPAVGVLASLGKVILSPLLVVEIAAPLAYSSTIMFHGFGLAGGVSSMNLRSL